ncbi:MAG: hypothetical protein H6983_12140 [Ectothiorhodospiraceae bacterium]|nr:hypothetical protein [Chromatiales bacterium]MCP5154910.1 hypothetical protein [Ectothiorhodospiraceae bacterium]
MATGAHKIEYEVLKGWEQMPEGWSFVEVAGVACDSRDRVYVFCRGDHPMIVFDKEGRFLDAWGEGVFANPHGIFIDDRDRVWCVDNGDHTVRRFDTAGNLELTIGEPGVEADTGFELDKSPVQRSAGPFNRCTNVAVMKTGEFYVADGYGNARVHKFAADGTLELSFGEPGSGPGQFNLPHGIALDSAGQVYVADRENSRVQIFSPRGEYLREWSWTARPCDLFVDDQDNIYIAELGHIILRPVPVHWRWFHGCPPCHEAYATVTITDPDGSRHAVIGGPSPLLPGNFIAPHGIWADSEGSFYVGEVTKSSGGFEHFAPMTPPTFQKFIRRAG